jgi:hypothetical protein
MFTNKELDYGLKLHQQEIYEKIRDLKETRNYIPEKIGLLLAPGAGKTYLTKKLCSLMGYSKDNILIISPLNAVNDNTWAGLLNVHFDAMEGFFGFNASFEEALRLFLLKNNIDINNLAFVVDEFHNLKNLDRLTRKLAKRIMKIAKTTIFLSGTPGCRNEYEEFNLINLCFSKRDSDFLGAKRYGLFYDVTSKQCGVDMLQPISVTNKKTAGCYESLAVVNGVKYSVEDREEWFQEKIEDPLTYKNHKDKYFNFEKKFYGIEYESLQDKFRKPMRDFIANKMFVFRVGEEEIDYDYSNFQTKEMFIRIPDDFMPREVLEDSKASELAEGKPSLLNYQFGDLKVNAILKILEKHVDEPIVIWSSYIAERDVIVERLAEHNIALATKENVQLFKEGKLRGIIASAFSDKEAHNWVHCRVNVYFSPNNSSTSFPQSRYRTNRIGQDKTVYYYFLYFNKEKEIHERMLKAYERNKISLSQKVEGD